MKRICILLVTFLTVALPPSATAREFCAAGRYGAVSTGHELATRAALNMLRRGGNAVDAAVAAGFTLAVADPSNSGLGGDGFALLKRRDGAYESWDASSRPPAAGRIGSSTIGLPTEAVLLLRLLERHGTKHTAEVLAPAIEAARDGVPVSAYLERRIEEKIHRFRDSLAIATFAPEGRPLRAGEILRQPRLAETLVRLAESGPDEIRSGSSASSLAADLASRGSFYTINDISTFEPAITRTVAVSVGSFTLVGPPPPSSAIAVMAGVRAIHRAETRSQKRLPLSGRISLLERLLGHMTNSLADSVGSPGRFLQSAELFLSPDASPPPPPLPDAPGEPSGETTHLVTWDRNGMIVSMTLTLGTHFGTCDVSPLGFFYNNELANFDKRRFRYPGTYPDTAGPVSTKSPLIILLGSKPVFALGGAGAGRIVSNLLFIVDALLHGEKSLFEAVMAPRLHISDRRSLQVEWSPAPPAPTTSSSFAPCVVRPAGSDLFGLVSAVGVASSGLVAVGDYRRDGSAGAVDADPDMPKKYLVEALTWRRRGLSRTSIAEPVPSARQRCTGWKSMGGAPGGTRTSGPVTRRVIESAASSPVGLYQHVTIDPRHDSSPPGKWNSPDAWRAMPVLGPLERLFLLNLPENLSPRRLVNLLLVRIGHTIPYRPVKKRQSGEDLLRAGYGDCSGKARLLRDLLTARGIPCRLVGGVILRNGTVTKTHIWTDVWLDGAWHAACPVNHVFGRLPANWLVMRYGDAATLELPANLLFRIRAVPGKRKAGTPSSADHGGIHETRE